MKFAQSLRLALNRRYRGNCPSCGGKNTFACSNEAGNLKFYCFKANCQVKGIFRRELSLSDIKAKPVIETPITPIALSDMIGWSRDIAAIPDAMQYLTDNNCIPAFEKEPKRFFYDCKTNRVVFVEYATQNTMCLATGRSLNGEKPKWLKYVAIPGAYFYLDDGSDTCTIVEDCASACSASRLTNSLALCGTTYNIKALALYLLHHKIRYVNVALDTDAFTIAMKLVRDLKGFGKFLNVRIIQAKDDLKYLDLNELKKELKYG